MFLESIKSAARYVHGPCTYRTRFASASHTHPEFNLEKARKNEKTRDVMHGFLYFGDIRLIVGTLARLAG
jgi:hypothetical protein